MIFPMTGCIMRFICPTPDASRRIDGGRWCGIRWERCDRDKSFSTPIKISPAMQQGREFSSRTFIRRFRWASHIFEPFIYRPPAVSGQYFRWQESLSLSLLYVCTWNMSMKIRKKYSIKNVIMIKILYMNVVIFDLAVWNKDIWILSILKYS